MKNVKCLEQTFESDDSKLVSFYASWQDIWNDPLPEYEPLPCWWYFITSESELQEFLETCAMHDHLFKREKDSLSLWPECS